MSLIISLRWPLMLARYSALEEMLPSPSPTEILCSFGRLPSFPGVKAWDTRVTPLPLFSCSFPARPQACLSMCSYHTIPWLRWFPALRKTAEAKLRWFRGTGLSLLFVLEMLPPALLASNLPVIKSQVPLLYLETLVKFSSVTQSLYFALSFTWGYFQTQCWSVWAVPCATSRASLYTMYPIKQVF